jgi:hypothetical protein
MLQSSHSKEPYDNDVGVCSSPATATAPTAELERQALALAKELKQAFKTKWSFQQLIGNRSKAKNVIIPTLRSFSELALIVSVHVSQRYHW